MQLYVVVFAFLAASWAQGGDASKCDQAVLFRLQELYHKYNRVPSDILATVSISFTYNHYLLLCKRKIRW